LGAVKLKKTFLSRNFFSILLDLMQDGMTDRIEEDRDQIRHASYYSYNYLKHKKQRIYLISVQGLCQNYTFQVIQQKGFNVRHCAYDSKTFSKRLNEKK